MNYTIWISDWSYIFFDRADIISKMMTRLHDASDIGFVTDNARMNDPGNGSFEWSHKQILC